MLGFILDKVDIVVNFTLDKENIVVNKIIKAPTLIDLNGYWAEDRNCEECQVGKLCSK